MINIEPPGLLDWLLLVVMGCLAGAINGLKSYSERGKTERAIVGAVEGATALFVTVTTFLILHSLVPVVFNVQIPPLGLIGISGVTAHIGLRQTIKLAMRISEKD